ncbi:MAG: hypothetical protein IT373_32880 [Polyangiaceae bacterium]|nr:hypothetical protein [Polyangiaceae bacterium]
MARPRRRPAELTSLLDVLFIISFAALIQVGATEREPAATTGHDQADAGAPPADAGALPADAAPPDASADSAALALAQRLAAAIQTDELVLVAVSGAGEIVALERRGDHAQAPGIPLVRSSPDRDVQLEYLGDTSPELRLCPLVRRRVDPEGRLGRLLIVVSTTRPLGELPFTLANGIRTDVKQCLEDANGVALLIDPSKLDPDGPP